MKPTAVKEKDETPVTGSEGTCPNCHRHIMLCPCHVVPTPKGLVQILDGAQYKVWNRKKNFLLGRYKTDLKLQQQEHKGE